MAGGNDVWIAGSDSSEEGKWRWFGSGQTWGYTNWNKGKTRTLTLKALVLFTKNSNSVSCL